MIASVWSIATSTSFRRASTGPRATNGSYTEGAWVSHVGDSRCYRIRNGVIEQLSYDHSLLWEYARLQHLDPDEVEDIPTNVIHRCLGPEPLVKVDIEGPHPVQDGDVFLLCSDGLHGYVEKDVIRRLIGRGAPERALEELIALTLEAGAPDNVTAIAVQASDPTMLSFTQPGPS